MADSQKMTHEDFIEYCRKMNIPVSKITRKYVYVDSAIEITAKGVKLPNISVLPYICDIEVFDWTDSSTGRTLTDYVRSNMKIGSIKIVRANTGLGLKDSKDLVDANWNLWQKELKK
jgi:ribosomal protein L7/L12